MARRQEFDRDVVVRAAKDAFWRHGYEASDLNLLEEATQLSRSSMYLAFRSKHGLFDEAIAEYLSTFTESLLGPVESEHATTADAAGVFAEIALLFRGDLGNRGCLIVNAIGELAGRDTSAARRGADLYERYRLAFINALARESEGRDRDDEVILDRAHVLAVCAMGVWITSRVDPAAAAQACDAMVRQIALWGQARPRRRSGTLSSQPQIRTPAADHS